MAFELPALPYATDALEPHIDKQTMEIHHDKHHQAYVTNLNKALEGKPEASQSIDDIIKNISKFPAAVRNNGGGHYNHSLFWEVLGHNKGGEPTGELAEAINAAFGSFADFKTKFADAGATRFGSGWAWLSLNNQSGKLEVTKTANGESPLVHGGKPLLGVDVWEHSYYIDYRNARPKYLEAWFDNLVNWEHVEHMFEEASA